MGVALLGWTTRLDCSVGLSSSRGCGVVWCGLRLEAEQNASASARQVLLGRAEYCYNLQVKNGRCNGRGLIERGWLFKVKTDKHDKSGHAHCGVPADDATAIVQCISHGESRMGKDIHAGQKSHRPSVYVDRLAIQLCLALSQSSSV